MRRHHPGRRTCEWAHRRQSAHFAAPVSVCLRRSGYYGLIGRPAASYVKDYFLPPELGGRPTDKPRQRRVGRAPI